MVDIVNVRGKKARQGMAKDLQVILDVMEQAGRHVVDGETQAAALRWGIAAQALRMVVDRRVSSEDTT